MASAKAFKPPSQYKASNNTFIEKTPIISALMLYGTRINGYFEETGSTPTLYTVPAGKVFFLVSVQLQSIKLAGANPSYDGLALISGYVYPLIQHISYTVNESYAESISYAIPLRMVEGEKINSTQANVPGNTSRSTKTFLGYEIDASLIPNLS